jgi:hypothetical protein
MATVKSGINKVGNNYYQSITQENSDGSVGTTFYRVDAQGNNGVPIYDVYKASGSNAIDKSFDPNATAEEQRLLSDPNSQLSQARAQQVISSNLNANVDQQSSLSQAAGGSGNQATIDENQPGAAGGSTPANPNVTETSQQAAPQSLKYPKDLGRGQDYIMFTAVEYIPPGLDETGSVAGQRQDSKRSSKGTVTLPIQAQINDSNKALWAEGNLDEISRMALNTATKLTKNELTPDQLNENLSGAINKFTDKSNTNQILAYLAESTIAKGQNIQGRFGGILNPNVELLFTGPTLRPFSFNFRMSPRGKEEAKDVKSIIRFFKQNMAPKIQDGTLFLKSPNTFLIKYQGRGEQGLNKIKECALIDCSVNYTPQGSYMTYEDGTMVSYFMSLTFSEIEPVYDIDYKDNHPIGF